MPFEIKKMAPELEVIIRNVPCAITIAPEGDIYQLSVASGQIHLTQEKRLVTKNWAAPFKRIKPKLKSYGYDISFRGILKDDFIVYEILADGKPVDFDFLSFMCGDLMIKSVASIWEGCYSQGELKELREKFLGQENLVIRALREPGFGMVKI